MKEIREEKGRTENKANLSFEGIFFFALLYFSFDFFDDLMIYQE